MTKKNSKGLIIILKWCKGCGICVGFCPKQVPDEKGRVTRPEQCIYCSLYEIRCPDLAIELVTVANEVVKVAL